ncbi:unnamed protein product [Caretta caretta]
MIHLPALVPPPCRPAPLTQETPQHPGGQPGPQGYRPPGSVWVGVEEGLEVAGRNSVRFSGYHAHPEPTHGKAHCIMPFAGHPPRSAQNSAVGKLWLQPARGQSQKIQSCASSWACLGPGSLYQGWEE